MIRSGELQAQWFSFPRAGPTPNPIHHHLTAAASLRLSHHIFHHHHFRLRSIFHSYFQKLAHHSPLHGLKEGFNFLPLPRSNASASACFSFFGGGGGETSDDSTNEAQISRFSTKSFFNGRQWTNVLLALNILVYIAQCATQDEILLWGAKINSLIDKGQLWRLVTSSFLHANIGHLLVNCYSLNSVGPTMEKISGPKRYLALYFASAIASSAMSYGFSEAPAVGASGAVFGLVGSLAVFVMRHRGLVGRGKEDLQQIAHVIVLNMAIGFFFKGIDNWGHFGGLLGGVATSWLLGPAWKYESPSADGRRIFSDKAPIFYLINTKKKS
ncbi:hypothetical protein ACFX1T_020086 [Malus domestica]